MGPGAFFDFNLKGQTPADWRHSLYYHYYERGEHHVPRHEGVRTDRYKLIHYYDYGQWDFFDLEHDPHEMKSLYRDPAYEEQVRRLKAELQRLRAQYGAPPLVPEKPGKKG